VSLAGWETFVAPGLEQRRESFLSATAFTPLFAKCKLQNDIRGWIASCTKGVAPPPFGKSGRIRRGQDESGKWKVRPGSDSAPVRPSSSSVMSTNKINVICVEGCNDCIIEQEYRIIRDVRQPNDAGIVAGSRFLFALVIGALVRGAIPIRNP